MSRPTIDPSLWPIPTVSESLWNALLNGDVSPEPYPPSMEHDLRNAVTKAYRLGLTDVAEFAQIELDRLLLAEELGQGNVTAMRPRWIHEPGLIIMIAGLVIAVIPFVRDLFRSSPPQVMKDFLDLVCATLGLMGVAIGSYLYILKGKGV